MPEYCTCGAQLPPDALFCHKCGKPQREIVEPEIVAPVQAPVEPPLAPPKAGPLTFSNNPIAIRTALLAAVTATVFFFPPYLNWVAAGFFAVFLYRRRTGQLLDTASGVRMGWLTGLLTFGFAALLFAIGLALMNLSGGIGEVQAEMKRRMVDPRFIDAISQLQNRGVVISLLVHEFVFMTLLSMAGGALGSKMLRRG
jgi:hypothetical protein